VYGDVESSLNHAPSLAYRDVENQLVKGGFLLTVDSRARWMGRCLLMSAKDVGQ